MSEFPYLIMATKLLARTLINYGCFKKSLAKKRRTVIKIFIIMYNGSNQYKTPKTKNICTLGTFCLRVVHFNISRAPCILCMQKHFYAHSGVRACTRISYTTLQNNSEGENTVLSVDWFPSLIKI